MKRPFNAFLVVSGGLEPYPPHMRIVENLAMPALLMTASCALTLGQPAPPTILEIDVENYVQYSEDTSDLSKFATNPNLTTGSPANNFGFFLQIADIVAVNGQPAKGTLTRNSRALNLTTAPTLGQAIADTVRGAFSADAFEILKSDGTPIGTIVTYGLGAGSPAPGAPLSITRGNFAIVGGTGAFLGARGYVGNTAGSPRNASVTEDPAKRRLNGGTKTRYVLQVIPVSTPQILTTSGGPAVTHSSDFTLVTASKPAVAGEILSLFATGLGPTVPGVDPGKPFPAGPPAAVNSPVAVTVNGKPAEVIGAVGYPGAVDGYQVNFRVPPDSAKGPATIQASAAWIAGPSVTVIIQ
jgi:uncharacterized protein (TIGR03437 family)